MNVPPVTPSGNSGRTSKVFSAAVAIVALLSSARLVKSVRTSVSSPDPSGGLMVTLIGSFGPYQPLLGTSTEKRSMTLTAAFIENPFAHRLHVCTFHLPPTRSLRGPG